MAGVIESQAAEPTEARSHAPAAVPMCPRCGYDQRGVMDSWKESCPLFGMCSECGLELDWKLVMDPVLRGPAWSFEHAPKRVARKWARTALVTLRPGRLFGELSMSHDIVVRRLVWFAVGSVLLTLAIVHLTAIALQVSFGMFVGSRIGVLLWPYEPRLLAAMAVYLMLIHIPPVSMVLLLSILDATLGRARVRRVHLVRGFSYSLPSVAPVLPTWFALQVVSSSLFGRMGSAEQWVTVGTWTAWLAWSLYWWWTFVSRYLRLRQAWLIVAVLMVPTVLLMLVVGVGFYLLLITLMQ